VLRTKITNQSKGLFEYKVEGKKHTCNFGVNGQFQTKHVTLKANRFEGFDFTRIQIRLDTLYPITIESCQITAPFQLVDSDQIFCKGYQSWSETGWYTKADKFKNINSLAKPLMGQMGDYHLLKKAIKKSQLRSWNYTYIKQENEVILFCGSCDEQTAFTAFLFNTKKNTLNIARDLERLSLQKGNHIQLFDLFFFDGFKQAAFKQYFEFSEIKPKPIQKKAGYTSWYNRFNKIDGPYLLQQLQAFQQQKIPIDYFQIDDGWQATIGDWLNIKPGFNSEMCCLARKISKAGYKPGLWLAPFICEKNSFIYKNKKEWLLKDAKGKPIKSGYNPLWSGWHYALNFYNEDFRNYLTKVFKTVFEVWQFQLVKLDFLYAVCLSTPLNKTRSEVMHESMRWLKEICVENEILACGVPLVAAAQNATFCRIGADADTNWRHWLRHVNHRERLSTINALKNTLSLYDLDTYYFYNDADVCLLRNNNNNLTADEKLTQLFINYIFGSLFFISDEIDQYDEATLQLYRSCFPLKAATNIELSVQNNLFKSTFTINESQYLMYNNLSDRQQNIQLPNKHYFNCVNKQLLAIHNFILPPHASVCLLQLPKSDVQLIQDSNHLLPEFLQETNTLAHK